MKESLETDLLYLTHIHDCITRITEYTQSGEAEFLADHKTQDAVMRNLQTMAESTQRLSSALKATAPEVRWQKIAGFRNVLTHDYLKVILSRIWLTIRDDLPPLAERVNAKLEEIDRVQGEGTQI